jgi:hypothetical protein
LPAVVPEIADTCPGTEGLKIRMGKNGLIARTVPDCDFPYHA